MGIGNHGGMGNLAGSKKTGGNKPSKPKVTIGGNAKGNIHGLFITDWAKAEKQFLCLMEKEP